MLPSSLLLASHEPLKCRESITSANFVRKTMLEIDHRAIITDRPSVAAKAGMLNEVCTLLCQDLRGNLRGVRFASGNMYLCFVFALYERKNETPKKIQYRSAEGKKSRLHKSRQLAKATKEFPQIAH